MPVFFTFRIMALLMTMVSLGAFTKPLFCTNTVEIRLSDQVPVRARLDDPVVQRAYAQILTQVSHDHVWFESPKRRALRSAAMTVGKPWQPTAIHAEAELWLAAVLFGECRGQDLVCMYAVGHVALNRAAQNLDARYGNGIRGVLRKKYQFSCLNASDPNYKLIRKAMANRLNPHAPDGIKWTVALGTAHILMHRRHADPTHGATFYHAASMRVYPKWISDRNMVRTAQIDGHIFYRKGG